MSHHLIINICFHEGWYYGAGDWPPAPARLFQALIAGVGLSGPLDEQARTVLAWLETLNPPAIAVPTAISGQSYVNFVPNNDLDSQGGDARRLGAIRTAKTIRPHLFDELVPLTYAWTIEKDDLPQATLICELADRLYQFGRGVDFAWAWGEVVEGQDGEFAGQYADQVLYRPTGGIEGTRLACPSGGSLNSLIRRYQAGNEAFTATGRGASVRQNYRQQPKPRFRQVGYDSPPVRLLYELRDSTPESRFAPWPLAHPCQLVTDLRDKAVERLTNAMPDQEQVIKQVLIGRQKDGANDGPVSLRARIIPLPSIGYHHADQAIRRILLEVPPGCPLRTEDVNWAFSGLEMGAGEESWLLIRTGDLSFFRHFGITKTPDRTVWQTVTPAALPEAARRRRIEPSKIAAEAKGGSERRREQEFASRAVMHALRHAGIGTAAISVRVQREPFAAHGERAESFAFGTRFPKERLWHVSIIFDAPVSGPLILGDGRFLGLGLMIPVNVRR